MNEQKHLQYDYFNPAQSKKQQSSEELIALIKMFISRNALTPKDFIALNKIIKQLNAQPDNLSNKVIRAMQKRFEDIKNKYQR